MHTAFTPGHPFSSQAAVRAPALAAMLLKGHGAKPDWLTVQMQRWFGGFFAGFNRFFNRSSERYGRGVTGVIQRKASAMGVYALLLGLTVGISYVVPGGFVPAQDKQYLVRFAQPPAARPSTAARR